MQAVCMGAVEGRELVGLTVADAMIHWPKLCDLGTTVADAREQLLNPKVHVLLVVEGDRLVTVVDRDDLVGAAPEVSAWTLGRLDDRVVRADDDLAVVTEAMVDAGQRRVAVVDEAGRLVGLLCAKRSGTGFCSDEGIAARAAERAEAMAQHSHLAAVTPSVPYASESSSTV